MIYIVNGGKATSHNKRLDDILFCKAAIGRVASRHCRESDGQRRTRHDVGSILDNRTAAVAARRVYPGELRHRPRTAHLSHAREIYNRRASGRAGPQRAEERYAVARARVVV